MDEEHFTNTVTVTSEDFDDQVIQSETPVLVDFWAEWCGPCMVIGPTLEALADAYKEKVKVAKLNVDDSPDTASRFGVRSIPTLILFKDGEAQQAVIGVRSKGQLAELIDSYLN